MPVMGNDLPVTGLVTAVMSHLAMNFIELASSSKVSLVELIMFKGLITKFVK